MPQAERISAKIHKFDASGNESKTDFCQTFTIIEDAGFTSYVGIDYKGDMKGVYNPTGGYLSISNRFGLLKRCANGFD